MGMRKYDLRYLQECFKDEDMPEQSCIRMCELGNQVIRSKGMFTRISKVYFASLGINHISIDLNGENDSLKIDLTKPITDTQLLNSFNVITNFGTTEHVSNQYQCFKNIHRLCINKGLFVHAIPMLGSSRYRNHGDYHYPSAFFHNLAKYCGYKILRDEVSPKGLLLVTMKKMEDTSFLSEQEFNQCGVQERIRYDKYTSTQQRRSRRTQGITVRYEQRRKWIYDRMQELEVQGKSILCVGARHDSELEFFEKRGFEAEGIDLYASGKVMACDMSGMLEHPYLKNQKYDIVFSNDSLEHCIDLHGFIKGLNTLCSKYFVCMCPSNPGQPEQKDITQWDCSIHKFMTDNSKYPEYLMEVFDQFQIVTSEVHKEGRRLFFILEKK